MKNTIERIKDLDNLKGNEQRRFFRLTVNRPLKVRKAFASEDLRKRTIYSGRAILADYEHDVNTQRAREGRTTDFHAVQCPGREHVSKFLLTDTRTRTRYYLALRVINMQVKSEYLHNGVPVDVSTIKPMLLASEYTRYNTANRQGVDNPITHITPAIDNITEFEISGKKII